MSLSDPVMLTVSAKQLSPTKTDNRTFTADASDAGFAPGEWPFFLNVLRTETEGVAFRRGSRITHPTTRAFLGYEYTSKGGVLLRLLND